MVGDFDQASSLAFGFLADFFHSNFLNDFQAGTRGFNRGNVRGSIHKAEGRIGVTDGAGRELERIFVREPSDELRFKFLTQVRANVEIGDAGASAKPFEDASAGEVGVKRLDVYGQGAKRLIRV